MGRPYQIEGIISAGQLIAHSFLRDALAASQTDVQLSRVETGATSGTSGVDEYVAPWDGEIVAIACELSAAATAGQLTVGPTVDGTEKTDLTVTITTETEKTATVVRGSIPFSAGDRIGAEITTNGSWDGTTADLGVDVYVIYNVEGI